VSDVTLLLEAYRSDGHAPDELIDVVYEELRSIAQSQWAKQRPGQTLQATALVHEAFIRLFGGVSTNWENRRHFFGAAAEVMRRVLVDEARRRKAEKRGGGMVRRSFHEIDIPAARSETNVVDMDEALSALSQHDPEAAELVKLRYFMGMTIPEAADTLGTSLRTANRLWKYARVFLKRKLRGSSG